MTVGLVLVSHSRQIVEGTADLARQMAPSVTIATAGGDDAGGLGTSFERIGAALSAADSGSGAVVLYDLGSALLTAETAVEFLEPADAERIRIVPAPLVEGAVAAAVAAAGGAALDEVAVAASASSMQVGALDGPVTGGTAANPTSQAPVEQGAGSAQAVPAGPTSTAEADIVNPLGLHARPAAALARALTGSTAMARIARVGVDDQAGGAGDGDRGVDVRSVLAVVGLALRGGDRVRLSVAGPDADIVLRRLTDLISAGFGEVDDAERPPDPRGPRLQDGLVRATPGAPGIAIGPLLRLDRLPDELPGDDPAGDPYEQIYRLDSAIAAAARRLATGGEFGHAHAALAGDPELRGAAADRIRAGEVGAAGAWWSAVRQAAAALAGRDDELIAARAVDLQEAGLAVLAELGVHSDRIGPQVAGSMVVATELGPAEATALVQHGAAGAVLAGGSTTAHAVIVAHGLGLPMVLRTADLLDRAADGTTLLVDGAAGTVRIEPPAAEADRARAEIEDRRKEDERLRAEAADPVLMPDGRPMVIAANIGSAADAEAAVAAGADGVGLLRTEILVLDRDRFPDEDTQTSDLAQIFAVMGERPVVVRVLDAGGDKPVRWLDVDAVRHGFLGVRGLRFLLDHPDLLHTQLRAICRAAAGHRVSVMAPMVTVRSEAERFRAAVHRALDSLALDGLEYAVPEQIGIMIEVPAAALAADQFVGVADFFSIGSNDLTSYIMAADRTESGVAALLDPSAAAVQRVLDTLFATAAEHRIPVSVCGEIAGSEEFAPALVARGAVELSMAPARIPRVKALLRGSLGRSGMIDR